MDPEDFKRYWEQTYPGCPPVGHRLRQIYSDLWFRIHSLPLSKDYIETESEWAELFKRHNQLIADVVGKRSTYVLLATKYSRKPTPANVKHYLIDDIDKTLDYSFTTLMSEDDPDPIFWHFFIGELKWEEGSVNPLLRLIENDQVENVLFINVLENAVYAPYDAGGDVFIESTEERDVLKAKYRKWLPSNHSGL